MFTYLWSCFKKNTPIEEDEWGYFVYLDDS